MTLPLRDINCRIVITAEAIAASRRMKSGEAWARMIKQEARGIAGFVASEGRRLAPVRRRYRRAFRRAVRRDLRLCRPYRREA